MSITPDTPDWSARGGFKHGSILNGNLCPYRVNSQRKSTISEVYGTSANIDSLAICEIEMGTQIYLVLDDHSAFRIAVEAVSP